MISIVQGDIVTQEVDAIVNASNCQLMLGSGVSGAIYKAGDGGRIQKEMDDLITKDGLVPMGSAVVTNAYGLHCAQIIHAVAMDHGVPATAETVRRATESSLLIAQHIKLGSIAFPALGSGHGDFPKEWCAEIMLRTAHRVVQRKPWPSYWNDREIRFVLFEEETFQLFTYVDQLIRLKV